MRGLPLRLQLKGCANIDSRFLRLPGDATIRYMTHKAVQSGDCARGDREMINCDFVAFIVNLKLLIGI